MTDIRPGTSAQEQFFTAKNEQMLDRLLYADFQRRVGGELTDKQKGRLVKTVKHYMTEVYAKKPGESVQFLNREVLTSVVPDFMGYLRRSNAPSSDNESDSGLRMDVSTRFGQLQAERQEIRPPPPLAPDFQMSLENDGPTPLSRFEEIKRIREAEAARETEMASAMTATRTDVVSQEIVVSATPDSDMGRFINSDTDFRAESEAARQRDRLAIIMREAERSAAGITEIVNVPDPRRNILLGENTTLPPKAQSFANGNPTVALPERVSVRPPLPQDLIRPQESIVSYKEVEHNLFVYSADRDWVNNTSENRYNFSVTFDPANNQPGFGYNTATNVKFKNITRIEFVKAIMPTEGIDVLPVYDMSGAVHVLNTDLNVSVLSLPYLQVRIPELNVNGYGTNDGMNNAFAAISYDAYWAGDSSSKNKGYTRMIPKFLKCQKVYYPTPLATLQKLSFQIQKPDGTLVSTTNDTLDISGIYMPTTGTSVFKHYFAATYDWLWIKTKTYFNKFLVSQGDRIIFKNIAMNATLVAAQPTGVTNLVNFLTRPEGHLVSDIGALTGTDASPTYTDTGVNGPGYSNAAGYSNGIIIRNSFADPTTGSTSLSPWVTAGFVSSLGSNPTATSGRLMNMNHQIQIIMRVITREMDSAAKLRPDNLQA
jgi:hypothetical protein